MSYGTGDETPYEIVPVVLTSYEGLTTRDQHNLPPLRTTEPICKYLCQCREHIFVFIQSE